MQRKDYYGILGVPKNADEEEIRTAYRKLALRNHPDTNRDDPCAEDRFKEISEAYDVLSHRDKRHQYDLGRDPHGAGYPFPPSRFDPWGDPFAASCFPGSRCRGGGFGRAFGRGRRFFRGTGARPAGFGSFLSDRHIHDLPLTPDEASAGAERDIRLHSDRGTLVFTVSIPAGVKDGALIRFKPSVGDAQEIELLFRVRIEE